MENLNNEKVAKALYEYFMENWDKYRANIHNPNVIKITSTNIRKVFYEKFPAEASLRERKTNSVIYPWLMEILKREFEKRNFRVKKDVKAGRYIVLYVYRQ